MIKEVKKGDILVTVKDCHADPADHETPVVIAKGHKVKVLDVAPTKKAALVFDTEDDKYKDGIWAVEMACLGMGVPTPVTPLQEKDVAVEPCCCAFTNTYNDEHYQGDVEPIELMQAQMTQEELIGFLKGNIIKYTSRCGKKDDPVKEVTKIKRYAGWLLDVLEGRKIDPRS